MVPIQGQMMKIMADTGGGPVLILSSADWQQLRPAVRVIGEKSGRFPTWGGYLPVKIVTVEELEVAGRKTRHAELWVCEKWPESTFGLGCFADRTLVLDFARQVLWVRQGDVRPAGR